STDPDHTDPTDAPVLDRVVEAATRKTGPDPFDDLGILVRDPYDFPARALRIEDACKKALDPRRRRPHRPLDQFPYPLDLGLCLRANGCYLSLCSTLLR